MKPPLSEDITSVLAIFAGTLVSAGLSAALLFREAPEGMTVVAREMATVPAVIATRDLPVGTTLTASDVKVVDWPKSASPPADYSWLPEQVIGLVVARPMIRHELVRAHLLNGPSDERRTIE